jgi:putative hydrolase of the HAD superfamily
VIEAVLLDLDDTLVAFDAVTDKAWRSVIARYCEASSVDPAALYGAVRRASDEYWSDPERHRAGRLDMLAARRRIVATAFGALDLPGGEASALADRYSQVRLEEMYLLPGAAETLAALRAEGTRLALLTNGESGTQRWKIDRFGLAPFFDILLVEGEIGFGKPDPRVFELALSRLGVAAEAACMVGDNLEWDIAGPQRLGIRGVWIDRKGRGVPPGAPVKPWQVITDISRLPAALA